MDKDANVACFFTPQKMKIMREMMSLLQLKFKEIGVLLGRQWEKMIVQFDFDLFPHRKTYYIKKTMRLDGLRRKLHMLLYTVENEIYERDDVTVATKIKRNRNFYLWIMDKYAIQLDFYLFPLRKTCCIKNKIKPLNKIMLQLQNKYGT